MKEKARNEVGVPFCQNQFYNKPVSVSCINTYLTIYFLRNFDGKTYRNAFNMIGTFLPCFLKDTFTISLICIYIL